MNIWMDSITLFQKGGPVMYLILLSSFLVAAIGVERFLYYKAAQTDMDGFIEKLRPLLEKREWEKAAEVCRNQGGVVADVAARGIDCMRRGVYRMESAMEGEAALAVAGLKKNLAHLDTIVTMAPLLGLLGTVVGMIQSFSVMNVKAGQPLAITGGVGEALVATASGLCVAMFSMAVYSYFTHRLDWIITQLEQVCTLVITQEKRENGHEVA